MTRRNFAIALIFSTTLSSGLVSATPTADEAVDCVVALMGKPCDSASSRLHQKATDDLRAWLQIQLVNTPEPRRAKILSAIMNTTIDDNLPTDKLGVYRILDERIYLSSRRRTSIMSFVTLVHELDHLFLDLNSPISNKFLRLLFYYIYPRSEVYRREVRAHASESTYFALLQKGLLSADDLYKDVLKDKGLSAKAQTFLLKLLRDATYENGSVRLKIYEEEKRQLAADKELERETMGALDRLLDQDLGDLFALDQQTQRDYVREGIRGYRAEIIKEILGRAGFYVSMSAAVYSLFH